MNKLIISGILIVLLASCHPPGNPIPGKPVISVSILPQRYFLKRLAGDRVEVNVMVPPGASPATYDPTATQLALLEHSHQYMKMGYLGFELGWMEKITSVNPRMKVVDLSGRIDIMGMEDHVGPGPVHGYTPEDTGHEGEHLHEKNREKEDHFHGGADPHLWMSARNAKMIAAAMYEALLGLIPGEQDWLTENFNMLVHDLDSLDQVISFMLAGLEGRHFLIYHPALTYFARDYGLVQVSLEQEGKEPSPGHMKWISDLGKELGVSSIFVQSQFDQANAEVLASEIGAGIVRINPLDEDWYNQMLYIASRLEASMQ